MNFPWALPSHFPSLGWELWWTLIVCLRWNSRQEHQERGRLLRDLAEFTRTFKLGRGGYHASEDCLPTWLLPSEQSKRWSELNISLPPWNLTHHSADGLGILWKPLRVLLSFILHSSFQFLPVEFFFILFEWRMSCNHFIYQTAKSPPIRTKCILFMIDNFWSYITNTGNFKLKLDFKYFHN